MSTRHQMGFKPDEPSVPPLVWLVVAVLVGVVVLFGFSGAIKAAVYVVVAGVIIFGLIWGAIWLVMMAELPGDIIKLFRKDGGRER